MCEKALFNFIITKLYRMDMYYNQLGYNLNMINPFNEINYKIKVHLTIGLVGYSGCGKSTLINILFNQLVCIASSSATDVTTKCSEYYLPVNQDSDNVGQIRFLDFPGINNETNYYEVVEPEINRKIKEYKKNREQIDLVLFYIPNGVERQLNDTGLELIKLLHSNKIKILFIINGLIEEFLLNDKKIELKNEINDNEIFKNIKDKNEILKDDFSNLINTNYYQYYNNIGKKGIPLIIEKIIDIIKLKDKNFRIKDITVDNYNEKLEELKTLTRLFELYKNMSDLRNSIRIKSK
jgi:GTP-binding protein EngB required for normal cell division